MNKEQQELLDEVYENYWNSHPDAEKTFQYEGHNIETRRMTKDEFVDMVKTDTEFAEKWGLKIEKRELSWEERVEIARKTLSEEKFNEYGYLSPFTTPIITYWLNQYNIPTKLITITYNNKTIESYE
jgi:hypothetical protein